MLRLDITKGGGGGGQNGQISPEGGPSGAAGGWNGGDPAAAADLRRRRQAEQIDLVLQRATSLAAPDRTLLEWVLRDGRTAVQVACLTKEPVRSIRRRVRRLMRRLVSPEFLFVIRERDEWPPTRRRVADACIVGGRSMKQAAKELRLSFHSVRRQMEVIAGAFEVRHADQSWNTPIGFRRDTGSRRTRLGANGGAM